MTPRDDFAGPAVDSGPADDIEASGSGLLTSSANVPVDDPRLSAPDSHKGKVQRLVLHLLHDHQDAGEIPTNNRFVFYELEGQGHVRKSKGESRRGKIGDPRQQCVNDALMWLRETGIIPWTWIEDETRNLSDFAGETYSEISALVNIDPWQGWAPLILAESRSLSGVLSRIAYEYRCGIAPTNGQAGGFLRTVVAPALRDNDRPVRYLGDWDHQGHQIELNTRRVLEREARREIDWTRLAITETQIRERRLTPMWKIDHRYNDKTPREAWEAEALGQGTIQQLVRDELDRLLPEPLADVLERERQEHARLQAVLDRLNQTGGES